jgi:hypothetical protein
LNGFDRHTQGTSCFPCRQKLFLLHMLILHYYVYLCQYFYEDLFALHLVTIGPNSNPLGQIWYAYILNGDNSYQKVLLFRRSLFAGKEADTSAMGAKHRPLRPNAGYGAEPD